MTSHANQTCRIHLVRHGTTPLNVHGRYRGRLEVPLDEQGWADARSAGAALSTVGLTAVYTSPLRRARDTARTIADAAAVADIVDADGLNNLEYGSWTALTSSEAENHDPVAFVHYQAFDAGAECPGGENLEDAADRIVSALLDLGARHPGESICAVSHAAMVRLALVRTGEATRVNWRRSLPNGSTTRFDVVGGRLHYVGAAADVPEPALS
jgi:broad specificity phosphatase PhoE